MSENRVSLACLHCKRVAGDDFQEIFDEVGLELQLDKLLAQHFQLKVLPVPGHALVLCNACVNRLIELVDLDEHKKQRSKFDEKDYINNEVEKVDSDDNEAEVSDEALHETIVFGSEIAVEEFAFESAEIIEPAINDDLGDNVESIVMEIVTPQDFVVEIVKQFDAIDVEAYLDAAIKSNMESMQFIWHIKCELCGKIFENYQGILEHFKANHTNEHNEYICALSGCNAKLSTTKMLARHIILMHSELQSLQIYGSCPDCDMKFSNFVIFNKHTCCRTIKRRAGMRNYCSICELEFPSFKRYVFHMQFHMVKHRPKICLICAKSFNDVQEFFEHVQYEHEQTLACINCDLVFKRKQVFEAHLKKHQLKTNYNCKYCKKQHESKEFLTQHLNECHHQQQQLQCDICNKCFTTAAAFDKHECNNASDVEVLDCCCIKCGIIACDKADLLPHVDDPNSKCYQSLIKEEILSTSYVCEFCDANFKSGSDLNAHRATGLHANELYACSVCHKQFNNLKRLRLHIKSHDNYDAQRLALPLCRMYMCNYVDCEAAYNQWTALYNHKQRLHAQQNNNKKSPQIAQHKCQFCGKEHRTKMSLSVHIARSHNNKNITCPTCNASYKNEVALQAHIDYMHVPVKCDHCHKVIKNRRVYETHERIVHARECRHFCSYCEKGFYYRSELVAHEKYVHPDKVYKCSECQFSTAYAKSLDIHMAMHKKNLQFECTVCRRKFARKAVLEIHMRRHQTQRQYICAEQISDGCNASFISNYLRNKHINSKHRKTSPQPSKRLSTSKQTTTSIESDEEIIIDTASQDVTDYDFVVLTDN